jgi:hypothetical protein
MVHGISAKTTDARDEKEKKRREKRLTPSGANHSRKTTMTEQTLLADLSRQFSNSHFEKKSDKILLFK